MFLFSPCPFVILPYLYLNFVFHILQTLSGWSAGTRQCHPNDGIRQSAKEITINLFMARRNVKEEDRSDCTFCSRVLLSMGLLLVDTTEMIMRWRWFKLIRKRIHGRGRTAEETRRVHEMESRGEGEDAPALSLTMIKIRIIKRWRALCSEPSAEEEPNSDDQQGKIHRCSN